MTRAQRWLIWVLAGIPIGVLLLAVCALLAANTPLGRRALMQGIARATDGAVSITGLTGRVPDRLRRPTRSRAERDSSPASPAPIARW